MYPFNVRVYGVLLNDDKTLILLSTEIIQGKKIQKFPGGGLQFGEGTIDCLKREWMEELSLSIQVNKHIYTTDFFQPSAFNTSEQVLSIYYIVNCCLDDEQLCKHLNHINTCHSKERNEHFHFSVLKNLTTDELTFPIDRKVLTILQTIS